MDEQIASVSIGCGLDLSGLTRDLDRINKMTSQVKVMVGVGFDDRQVSTQINKLAQSVSKSVIRPTVDHRPLTELNKHLSDKQRHLKEVDRDFKKTKIAVRFDLKSFGDINKAFDVLDGRVDKATRKLKDLGDATKKIQSIGSIKVDVTGTVGGRSSSAGGSRDGDDRKLAQEIGREVAKNIGKGSIGGTLKSIASIPLKIAGNAVGKVAEGITYGITQEVSKGLGKGLSTAIETTLFKGVGSSELAAEKLGSALAESLMGSFNKQMKGFVKFDENDNPLLPKFLSDNIKNPRQRANLRKFYKELIDAAKAGQQELINTLGGQDTIAEESLAARGRARSDRRSRRPVAQEQAAYERQQAYRRESDIRSRVPQRLAEVEQDLAEAKEESRQIQEQYKQIEKEVLKAEKFAEEAGKRRAKAQQAYGAGLIDKAELKKAEDLEKKFKDRAAEVSKRITQPILEPKFQQQYQSEFQKYQKDLEAAQKKYQETLNQRNKARENFAKGYLSRDQLKIFEDAETNAQVELTKRSQPFRAPQLEKRLQSQLEDSRSAIAQVRQKRRQGGLSTEEEINLDKLESVSQQRLREAERNMFSLGERMQQVGSRIGGLTSYRNLLKAAEQQATQAKKEADARFDALLPDTAKLPKAYQQLLETVTGKSILDIDPDTVPLIRTGSIRQQANAAYTAQSNTIDIRPDYLQALNQGALDPKQALVMLHELQHGQDLQFGSFKGMVARRIGKPINPSVATDQERQELMPFVSQYDPAVRELEFNAELVARRNFAKYRQREKTEQVQSQQYIATRSVSQSKKSIQGLQQSLKDLQALTEVDPEMLGDVQAKIKGYSDLLAGLNEQFKSLWSDIAAIDPSTITDATKFSESIASILSVPTKKVSTARQIVQPYVAQQYRRIEESYGDPFTGQLRKPTYPIETDDSRFRPADDAFVNAPDVWNLDEPPSGAAIANKPTSPSGGGFSQFVAKASDTAYKAGQRARQGIEAITSFATHTAETFDAFGMQAKQGYNIASGVAQRAGQGLSAVSNNRIVQGAGQATFAATGSLVRLTKTLYQSAEAAEELALSVIPLSRTAKFLIKDVAMPFAAFSAATHFLPGGAQAGQAIVDLASNAGGHLAQMGAGAATSQYTGFVAEHAPGFMRGGMTSLGSAAIDAFTNFLGGPTAAVAAKYLAGRTMQNVAALPMKTIEASVQPSQQSLPASNKPLQLPSADKQKEVVMSDGQIEQASAQIASGKKQRDSAKKTAMTVAKKAGEASRSLLDATIATIRSADEAIQEAEKLSNRFWDAHKQIKELASKKQISQADIDKAKAYLNVIQNTGKSAIADIGYMAKQLGEKRFEDSIGSRLSNRQSQISRAQKNAQKLVRKMKPNEVPSDAIDVSSIDAPLERLKEEQIRAMAKDLVVNTAGFAASTALGDHGIIAQLGGDLGGALVARQAVNMGEAGVTAYNQLKDDDLFKAADALKKFTMIVQQASKVMQSEQFQSMQGNEVFADIAGFTVGNSAATLLSGVAGIGDIPMKGAVAAMAIVPQLAKLREGIQKQLAAIQKDVSETSSPDAPLERLKFGKAGLNPDDAGDEDQKLFLQNILALLDDAIAKSAQFDQAFKKVKETGYQGVEADPNRLGQLEKQAKGDPRLKFSYKGIDRKTSNPAEAEFLRQTEDLLVEATIAAKKFDEAFRRLDRPSLQKLEESLEGANKAFDDDGKEIIAEVQREIANYEAIVKELDESYRNRSIAAAEKLKEQVEYRQAYAEMMGIDPDSAEGMAGLDIPMPKEDGLISQYYKAITGDATELMQKLGGIPGVAKKAIGALLGFVAIQIIVPIFQQIASGAVEAAREFERFERTLGFITGSAEKAQATLSNLRSESNRLGIDLRGAIAGQTQLMAATRGTSLEGAATEQIGAATRQASSVYGLTPEQFDRMNLAITQMASKGKVSAEELRCYAVGTEVLTDKGWTRWEDVDETCLFISRNLKTGKVEYQKPKRLIRFHHKGKMFKVKNDRIDLLVTPEHRMVVKEEGETEYKIVEARDLENKPYYYLIDVDGTEEAIVYPEETEWVDYDDEAFCVEVPFTTLFIRRSGRTCWSGNSQLGEVLPGAFQIFARSIGVTTAQLDAMLMRGEVGTDSLIRFAAQLSAETSTGVAGAANSSQAALNRFNNTVYELQTSFGKALLPAQSLGLEGLTKVLQVLEGLIPVITTSLLFFSGKLLLTLSANAVKAAVGATSLQGVLLNLPKAIGSIAAMIAPIAAQIVVFMAVADLFTVLKKKYSDAAGASRDFANSANDAMERYLNLTGEAVDETTRLANALKNLPESYAEDTGTGKLAGLLFGEDKATQFFRQREQDIARGAPQDLGSDIARLFGARPEAITGSLADNEVGSNPFYTPYSEKQGQDIITANQEGAKQAQSFVDRLVAALQEFDQGVGDLSQVRDTDIRMRDLQAKRSLLSSDDTEGRRAIDAAYNALAKQREEFARDITALQSAASSQISAIEASNKEIEEKLQKGGLSPDTQKKLQKELENNKKIIEETQKGLEGYAKAINIAIESAAKLQAKFETIVASLDILNTQTQTLAAQDQTRILGGQLAGNATPGQSQSAQASAEQQNLARTIANLSGAIGQLEELMRSPAISRALTMTGLDQNVDALTLNEKLGELREAGVTAETSQEFDVLQKYQQQLSQRDQLKQQIAQSQQQLVQSQVQASEAVRDATKQVAEFYRNIQRQTEDLQNTLKQQQFETQIQNLKNDLNRSLSGFSDVFFGDMWGSLNELFDLATERSRLITENAQKQSDIQRQAVDTARQGSEQMRSTYGGSGGQGSGLFTGPSANIGGSSDYHIDAKFVRSLGIDKIVELFDQMAKFYAEQGRQIEFSNAAVSGQVYRVDDPNRGALLQQAFAAHHSQGRDAARGVYSVDYYIPTVGTDRFSSSVEGAELAIPSVSGGRVDYASGGGYGNYANVYDAQGNLVMQTGHGDDSRALPSGFSFQSAIGSGLQTSSSPQPTPVSITNLDSLFSGGSNSPIAQVIGVSEGTRTPGGGFTNAYGGHTDPGNAAHNMGSFSYQGGASSPEQADVTWLNELRGVLPDFVSAAKAAGLDPNDPRLLMNFLDLYTQSPLAATASGGFLDQLPRIAGLGVSDASIVEARWMSYRDPSTGQIDAPGFGNNPDRLLADQQRRVAAVEQGISATFGGSGSIAATGSQTVDTAPIAAGVSQAQANAQAAIASADARLQSDLDRIAIQEEQVKRRSERQRQEGLDRIAQQNTELRRQQDETILGAFGDSESAGVLRELRANNNQLTDATLSQQRQLRDLSDTIANTETYIDFYQRNPTAPGSDQLPQLQEALTQVQSEYTTLKALVERQTAVSSQARTRIIDQRQEQLLERSRASDLETLGLQNQLSIARTPEGLGRNLLQSQQATDEILREYTKRSDELRRKAEELQTTLDETIANGVEYSADEIEAIKQEIQANLNEAVALDNQATLKVEIELENRQQVIDQFAEDLGSRARDAQVQYLQNRGDTFGANDVQRRYGISQQNIQYQQDAAQLDAMALTPGADLNQIAQMRSDLESLNQFNLDNLRMQFPDLADSINSTAFQAFQNLGSSIAEVFANAKSGEDILKGLGNAFQQFAGQIIQNLLNMAAQAATSELFGLFFPQKGGASGGGVGSLFGSLAGGVSSLGGASFGSSGIDAGGGFNLGNAGSTGGGFNWGSLLSTGMSLIGGFNEGGLIPGQYTGTPDQHLAMVNPGEFVMNRSAVQRIGVDNLEAMNNIVSLSNLPRFNNGGYRDYAGSTPNRSYRDYSAESDRRTGGESSGAIEVKVQSEVINNVEYVRKEQFEQGMKQAADEGAKKGEERVRKGISGNPSYRRGMGIN